MRKLLAVTAAALLAASTGALACGDYETSASASAEQLGLAQPPAAMKVPAATVAKVSTPKAAKPTVVKEKTATPQSDRTLVVYRN